MQLTNINKNNRNAVNEFLITQWISTDTVTVEKTIDETKVNKIIESQNNNIIGLSTYEITV